MVGLDDLQSRKPIDVIRKNRPILMDALFNLATALSDPGKLEDAVESLTMAVSLNPDDGHVRKNLGAILSRCGSADEAIVHLQAAARLLPSGPRCWFNPKSEGGHRVRFIC